MHEITRNLIHKLHIPPHRPLVICDVDEVVVHYTRDFEVFLDQNGYWLDTNEMNQFFATTRHKLTNIPVAPADVHGLVVQFFSERTRDMQEIEGAVFSLLALAEEATVVMLTNLPHEARDDRIYNLARLGLPFPVITNSGAKGPAIELLASHTSAPVVFIDDSPGFIHSAFTSAPHVHLVHFIQDQRFSEKTEYFDFVSLRTGRWEDVLPHVQKLLRGELSVQR